MRRIPCWFTNPFSPLQVQVKIMRLSVSRLAATVGVLLSMGFTRPALAQATRAATPALTAAQRELLTLSRTKWQWMADKQVDSLAALFHGEAMFVHMGGSWGRARELDIIRSGGIHYKHAEIFEASAHLIDSTAIVYNRIRLDAVVGGNEVSNPFVATEVYVRQGGRWQLASLAFTRLTQ
jgi:hypothetical protein